MPSKWKEILAMVWHDCETDQIAIQVHDMFDGMILIVNISSKTSVLIACLDILISRFDGDDSNLDKVNQYKCGYDNGIDTITITNAAYKICDVTRIVILFLTTIYFTIKAID